MRERFASVGELGTALARLRKSERGLRKWARERCKPPGERCKWLGGLGKSVRELRKGVRNFSRSVWEHRSGEFAGFGADSGALCWDHDWFIPSRAPTKGVLRATFPSAAALLPLRVCLIEGCGISSPKWPPLITVGAFPRLMDQAQRNWLTNSDLDSLGAVVRDVYGQGNYGGPMTDGFVNPKAACRRFLAN